MITECQAVRALVDALRRSTGATPALKIFAWPGYPDRELRPQAQPDGTIALTLSKWGWHYKRKSPRPSKTPPPADTDAIKKALNAALAPGYTIQAVEDHGTQIQIFLEENRNDC